MRREPLAPFAPGLSDETGVLVKKITGTPGAFSGAAR